MSLCIFSPCLPSSNSVPCNKTVYFDSFLHEVAIISRTVHTVVEGAIYACLRTSYKSAICLIMYPNDRLHSAGATTISLDSFRGLGSSYVPLRGILCLTPHHVFSLRWVCAPVLGLRSLGCGLGFPHVALGLVNLNSRTWSVYLPQGPTNAMHVFVRRATCIKHMNK